ncbi:MAG: hypothetical protein HY242_09110 [Afipia sp.]|nr:hypothetical protein [Afipia sp.]
MYFILRAALAAVVLFSGINSGNAENLTAFEPSIALECRDAKVPANKKHNCEYRCFALGGQTPAANPASGVSVYAFERIEFFSKAGQNSEQWLIVLKGVRGSVPAETPPPAIVPTPGPVAPPPVTPVTPSPLAKIFLSLGRDYMCSFETAASSTVELIKYY